MWKWGIPEGSWGFPGITRILRRVPGWIWGGLQAPNLLHLDGTSGSCQDQGIPEQFLRNSRLLAMAQIPISTLEFLEKVWVSSAHSSWECRVRGTPCFSWENHPEFSILNSWELEFLLLNFIKYNFPPPPFLGSVLKIPGMSR